MQKLLLLDEILHDSNIYPEDFIQEHILPPHSFLTLWSPLSRPLAHLKLTWMMHCAAGELFLGMKPSRPLKIFMAQSLWDYPYLREKIHQILQTYPSLQSGVYNLLVDSDFKQKKDIATLKESILSFFRKEEIDLICLDMPLEMTNEETKIWLFDLKSLQDSLNPTVSCILTSKTCSLELQHESVTTFSLLQPDDRYRDMVVSFSLRYGEPRPSLVLDLIQSRWIQKEFYTPNLKMEDHPILKLLQEEALEGKIHTANSFRDKFANSYNLGTRARLYNKILRLIQEGYLFLVKIPHRHQSFGYLCTQNMHFQDKQTQKITILKPTHTLDSKRRPVPLQEKN